MSDDRYATTGQAVRWVLGVLAFSVAVSYAVFGLAALLAWVFA